MEWKVNEEGNKWKAICEQRGAPVLEEDCSAVDEVHSGLLMLKQIYYTHIAAVFPLFGTKKSHLSHYDNNM